MEAYVSGPLTGVEPDPTPLYEFTGELLGRHGLQVYLPHRATDPRRHRQVTPTEVYARDRMHVLSADLVVAFLTPPSLGVGMELELAAAALLPIIAFRRRGAAVSRMALGTPARLHGPYEYDAFSEIEAHLAAVLPGLAESPRRDLPLIGPRVLQLRDEAGLTRVQLAELMGTTSERVRELEEDEPRVSNPSLILLTAAAAALGRPLVSVFAETNAEWQSGSRLFTAPSNQLKLGFDSVSDTVAPSDVPVDIRA